VKLRLYCDDNAEELWLRGAVRRECGWELGFSPYCTGLEEERGKTLALLCDWALDEVLLKIPTPNSFEATVTIFTLEMLTLKT
jgi:hypothetical protein